jgi:hypothetical protein
MTRRARVAAGGSLLLLIALLCVGCGSENENSVSENGSASPQTSSANNNAAKSDEGSIQATPNPVPAGPGSGKTKITWSTKGSLPMVKVYVSENGQPETVFAQGAEGSVEAPWIGAGTTYEFRLYAEEGSKKRLINKVQVTRNK